MKNVICFALFIFVCGLSPLFGQNEKLEVDGVISTTDGGVQFPDQTLQTTAYIPPTGPTAPAGLANPPFILLDGESDTVHLIQISSLGAERELTSILTFEVPETEYLTFTKQVDKWTPQFFEYLSLPGHLHTPDVTLHLVNENNEVYHKIELKEVRCMSQFLRTEYTGYGYMNLEVVTLYFDQMESRTLIQNPVLEDFCWNFRLNGTNCN